MLSILMRKITDAVFPPLCHACGKFEKESNHQPLCQTCLRTIPYNCPPFCLRCSRHILTPHASGLCQDCRTQPPQFDDAWIMTRYLAPMPSLIKSFKFYNKTSLRKTFTLISRNFFERYSLNIRADMLIPIPIHQVRLRERSYNQSLLLAEGISSITNIPLYTEILRKTALRPRQSQLNRKERWTNIRGAFKIETSSTVRGKVIFLVDDLLTTGATASEAAVVLKQAGAAKVGLIALSSA